MSNHAITFVIVAITAAVTAGGPVLARTIADFARNADKVDGRHAVGPRAPIERRAGKLVATKSNGRLPNNIIRKAPLARDAQRLGGKKPDNFVADCDLMRGYATVPADVAATFEDVDGFATLLGGPIDPSGDNCHFYTPRARHMSVGVYRVELATVIASECQAGGLPDEEMLGATITVIGRTPLSATYEPVCDESRVVAEVYITDESGAPQDASFAMALFDEKGIPIP